MYLAGGSLPLRVYLLAMGCDPLPTNTPLPLLGTIYVYVNDRSYECLCE